MVLTLSLIELIVLPAMERDRGEEAEDSTASTVECPSLSKDFFAVEMGT